MLDGFTAHLRSTKKKSVFTGWGTKCQLIESDDLTAGSQDTGTSSLGHSKGAYLKEMRMVMVIGGRWRLWMHTLTAGTSNKRESSVTVPTTTTVVLARSHLEERRTKRDNDNGGRFTREV